MPLPVPDDRNPSPKAATNASVLRKCISLQPFPNILTFFRGQLRQFFEDFLDYSLRDFNLSICPRDRQSSSDAKKEMQHRAGKPSRSSEQARRQSSDDCVRAKRYI
jgi:hypothetical protein